MVKRASYGYTIAEGKDSTPYKRTLSDKESETFDEDRVRSGQGMLVNSTTPDRKAMRYMGDYDKQEANFDVTGAGSGRGKQGGPTAKQANQSSAVMSDSEKAARKDAAEMKRQERTNKAYEDASKDMKKGGSVSSASSRADGCAERGKTRGTMIMCGGGMAKK